MTRRDLLLDVAVAVTAAAVALGIVAGGGFGDTPSDAHRIDGLAAALVLTSTLPLAARRRAPLVVYGVTAVATFLLQGLGYPADVPVGPVVAVYTLGVAYGGERIRRVVALAAVACFVPATAAAYAGRGIDVGEILVPELATWLLFLVGVWIAGDRARLRRARIAELEERAQRARWETEQQRRLAVAEERTRIARELHDWAGHTLNVILVQAGAARLLQQRDPDGTQQALATIEELARRTVGEIDQLVQALRTEDADDPVPADPAAAVDALVQRHRAAGLRVTTDVRVTQQEVPRSVAWAAYRILQESLTNAARYGDGSAALTASFGSHAVDITVTNPVPQSRTPARVGGGGHGIAGMRERAELLGGALDAAEHGGEFRLSAHLPEQVAA